MRKHITRHIRNIAIICILTVSPFVRLYAQASQTTTIKAGVFFADGFFEPADEGYKGYAYDVYQQLARVNQWRYEFVECSLAQCLDMLAKGEVDVVSGISINAEREQRFDYTSIPMGVQSGSLFIRNPSIPYGALSQIKGMKIGLLYQEYLSSRFAEIMADNKITFTPVYFETFPEVYEQYRLGTIDGFVSHNLDPIKDARLIYDFEQNYIYFITAKGNSALVQQLNQGLAILRRNGMLQGDLSANGRQLDYSYLFALIVVLTLIGCISFGYYVSKRLREQEQSRLWKSRQAELRLALNQHQFFPVYQAIVDCRDSKIAHLEALIRWRHETLGILSPARFLDDIGTCGLMLDLFKDTLDQVLDDYNRLFRKFPPFQHDDFHISINITYEILTNPEFIDIVAYDLEKHRCEPHRLCFEITEQSEHININLFNQQLHELRSLGCRIAMDDFGMEYSSLLTLKQSDFDIYKIDKYFIDDILSDKTAQSITAAIITIARMLEKEVIAEGVETAEQVTQMMQMDCHLIQGFYFSRPDFPEKLIQSIEHMLSKVPGGAIHETA